jgi:excisionase family DNA binding protein
MSAMMMEQDQGDRELTLDEVARRLGISYDTVLRRVRTKRIRARKEGQEWRVKESDLQKYIESTYLDG